jgi:hypothetical protein
MNKKERIIMTDKQLEQKASDLMNVFFEFMCDSDLEKYIDDNASLTESGEYLLAVIKKWLKDNVMEVQWEAERTRLWTPWTK